MEYKVKKGVSKEPLLWGLKIPQFVIFIAVVVINTFVLAGGLSIIKFLIALGIIVGTYLILRLFSQKKVIKTLFSENFPESLKNDL